jgi:hypothetical protein
LSPEASTFRFLLPDVSVICTVIVCASVFNTPTTRSLYFSHLTNAVVTSVFCKS